MIARLTCPCGREHTIDATPPGGDGEHYVDLRKTGCYRHALAAVKAGQLTAFRLPGSRHTWVRAADLHAWIESPIHRVRPAPPPVPASEPRSDIQQAADAYFERQQRA